MTGVEMNVKTVQKYFKLSDYTSSDMQALQKVKCRVLGKVDSSSKIGAKSYEN